MSNLVAEAAAGTDLDLELDTFFLEKDRIEITELTLVWVPVT